MVSRILSILILTLTTLLVADEKDPGAITFRDNCSACHQFDGTGNESMKAPSLGGLPRRYVSDQLRQFRAANRGGDSKDASGYLMHMTALKFDDRIIAYLGHYVQNLKPNKTRQTQNFGSEAKGKQLYATNCRNCHGEKGIGNKAERIPPLDKQPDWYLVNQLQKFEKDLLKHSEVKIKKIYESEMKDIASYLASLKNKTKINSEKESQKS